MSTSVNGNDQPHLIPRGYTMPQDIPKQQEDSGLPNLKDKDLACCARPANKPCFSIHFIQPDGAVRSMQYVHLCSDSNFTPEYIRLTFLGTEPLKVLIHGRNLWKLYDDIHRHVMPWVMAGARDMGQGGDGDPFVERVLFEKVKEED